MIAAALAFLAKVPWYFYVDAFFLGIIGFQALEVHHYKAAEATYKASDAIYQFAQKTNLATISVYQKANKLWADAAKAQQAKAASYVQQDATFAKSQKTQSANADKAIKVIYVNSPSARAWSAVPVDLSIAAQLSANAGGAH